MNAPLTQPPVKVMLVDIVAVISNHFKIPPGEMRSPCRVVDLVSARHAAWFLAMTRFEFSSGDVGRWFNRRRNGVWHGCAKARERMARDPSFASLMNEFESAALERARLRQHEIVNLTIELGTLTARRIVELGERAAMKATVAEIMAMAEALSKIEDQKEGTSNV
ncbi:MAG: helix-turn-helix domain-containing protein [Methylocystis sp.]